MFICFLIVLSIFLSGIVMGRHFFKRNSDTMAVGKLRVDTSDSDGPFLFLEITEPVETFAQRKYVTLEVDISSYISQD